MEDWDMTVAEYHDILMADGLVTFFYVVVLLVLIGCLFLAIQTFRRRISWGQARVMGVPFATVPSLTVYTTSQQSYSQHLSGLTCRLLRSPSWPPCSSSGDCTNDLPSSPGYSLHWY